MREKYKQEILREKMAGVNGWYECCYLNSKAGMANRNALKMN